MTVRLLGLPFRKGREVNAALWGVIIGGLLTIGGQTVAELLKAQAQSKARNAERETARRDFHREALELATESAVGLQAVLVEYEAAGVIPDELELRLRQAISEFERLVPRVASDRVRSLLSKWEDVAVKWANSEALQTEESAAWKAAVEACGTATRSYL